jgi:hypothetical protein
MMNQTGFNPYLFTEVKRRQEELIKMVAQYRSVEESHRTQTSKIHKESKLLAFIGKELADLGASLESRYSDQAEARPALNQQHDSSGCS